MQPNLYTWAENGWQQTFTGKAFVPSTPTPDMIDIEDVGHALAHQCRFAGHAARFYSVAEHAVLVSRILEARFPDNIVLQAAGLHHDDSEAYLVDVPRPVKPLLQGYREIEASVMAAVAAHFGLPVGFHEWPDVKAADCSALRDEAETLMVEPPQGFGFPADWTRGGGIIEGLEPSWAKINYLARHTSLLKRFQARQGGVA